VTTINHDVAGVTHPLQFWDTAGQEMYRTIIPIYFRGASFAIVAFAITDRESFDHLGLWFEQIDLYSQPGVSKVIVATKYDLPEHQVDEELAGFHTVN
jgi:GTPase SAR1 family protein